MKLKKNDPADRAIDIDDKSEEFVTQGDSERSTVSSLKKKDRCISKKKEDWGLEGAMEMAGMMVKPLNHMWKTKI